MSTATKLRRIFDAKVNTQLMQERMNLLGITYYKVADQFYLRSYFQKNDQRIQNIKFSSPVILHALEEEGNLTSLTIRALKDTYDIEAVELIRSLARNEVELSYSHLASIFLAPKLRGEEWNNWKFGYNLSEEENLKIRKDRTLKKSAALYESLRSYDFTNKRVLFLGCGDGDEIQSFLNIYGNMNPIIIGIDQSEVAIQNCQRQIKANPTIDFTFFRSDINTLGNIKHLYFDCIFAFGVFDRETLHSQEGEEVLSQILKEINFQYLATSAYSFELFSRLEYERMGFKVLESGDPTSCYTRADNFYYLLSPKL